MGLAGVLQRRGVWAAALVVAMLLAVPGMVLAQESKPADLAVATTSATTSATTVPADSAGAGWPCFRGANRDGISKAPFAWPKNGPKQVWKTAIGGGHSAVSIGDGRLFTMGNKENVDTVWCLDVNTGKEIWKYSYPCKARAAGQYDSDGPGATPTIDGKVVYTLSRRGDLFCFEAQGGKIVWKKNLKEALNVEIPTWGLVGSPVVYGKMLLLNVGAGGLALDKANGEVIWKSVGSPGYSTPVLFQYEGKTRLALIADKSLAVVEPDTGKEVWRQDWKTPYEAGAADPIIVDGTVFLSSGYNFGAGLFKIGADAASSQIWRDKKVMRNHFHTCMLWEGNLYGIDGDQQDEMDAPLKCLDMKTGKEKWKHEGLGFGGVMIAGGKLVILTQTGELVAAELSPEGYKEIGKAKIIDGKVFTVPVILNDRLYARNTQGDLVCVSIKGE